MKKGINIDIPIIINHVCNRYGITREDLVSDSRLSLIVEARRETAKRLRKENLSLPSIAFLLHKKDHSTIVNYLNS